MMETIILMPESGTEEESKKNSSKSGAGEQVVRKKIREGKSRSSKSSDKTSSHKSGRRKGKKSEHSGRQGQKHSKNKVKCCGATCSTTYNLFSWLSSGGGGPMSFKQGALLFCGGVAAGVGAALLFFKTGGAAAAAVGGLAGLGVGTGAKSDIKGSNNTVVGSGSNALININQVKGGSEKGADDAHKLTFAGMSEDLKLECLQRGMTYIDPTTGAWWGFDSVGGRARCLFNIPYEMIKGECRLFYNAEQLVQKNAKAKFEIDRHNIEYNYQLTMKKQREKERKEFNGRILALSPAKRKRNVPAFKEPKKPTPTQQARMEFLNTTRGEEANQEDFTEGLQWLKNATDKK
ncbi:MAG: hypothetical protein ACRCWB_03880 [Enterovibrio sp.]